MVSLHLATSVLILMLLAGCADERSFTTGQGRVSMLETESEKRIVFTRPSPATAADKQIVVCAEPSPDVAKAVSKSFDLGGQVQASAIVPQTGTPISGEAALALSYSRAQAIAQLGQRLATIQLLRDGLYRACEAYGNGAISDISYALLLSRYGDVMVTLLGQELIAGNFGGSLAAVGTAALGHSLAASNPSGGQGQGISSGTGQGAAQGGGGATQPAAAGTSGSLASDPEVTSAQKAFDQANAEVAQGQTTLETDTTAASPDATKIAQDRNNLAQAKAKVQSAEANLRISQLNAISKNMGGTAAALSSASANVVNAASLSAPSNQLQNVQAVSQGIQTLQREYLEAPGIGPVLVACATALESQNGKGGFATYCKDSLLTDVRSWIGKIVDAKTGRVMSPQAADYEFVNEVYRIKATQELLKILQQSQDQSGQAPQQRAPAPQKLPKQGG